MGGRIARISGAQRPKMAPEAPFSNFFDFSGKLFLKNEIKSENLSIWG